MDLTTPLIAFLFVCLIFPKIVRNRAQFYISFALLVFILLFHILAAIFPGGGFAHFLYVLAEIFRLVTFILLVLCAGGLSLHELTGEVFRSFEVMRRGDTEKTVIIPLTGQKPKPREPQQEPEDTPRHTINDPTPPPPSQPNPASIPLDEPRQD
ncbi:MAG TPA: hypothetical protein VGQ99_15380 [Tepidisphaeraceae bacterium]|nr:hypothetical protein [Tepidisphaeraceae bacterium]